MALGSRRTQGGAADAAGIVQWAWDNLPTAHRSLLESIGASQWQVVGQPLGEVTDAFLRSAGLPGLAHSAQATGNRALAVWVKALRIVLINESHPKLVGLEDAAREQFIAYLAWHEWGHALSMERCSSDDLAAGARLLALAPPGVRKVIRTAGYVRRTTRMRSSQRLMQC